MKIITDEKLDRVNVKRIAILVQKYKRRAQEISKMYELLNKYNAFDQNSVTWSERQEHVVYCMKSEAWQKYRRINNYFKTTERCITYQQKRMNNSLNVNINNLLEGLEQLINTD